MTNLKCSVKECVHNDENKHCMLESITVEGKANASRPEETECASFEMGSEIGCGSEKTGKKCK